MRQYREWLDVCRSSHSACNVLHSGYSPLRLLDLHDTSDDGTVRLVDRESANLTRRFFAALSYCWGQTGNVTTTKAVLDQHKTELMVSEMPATIQDAIRVTRGLGLRYLWIDALCIVQDDETEKQVEIAHMMDIYSTAAITIFASRAAGVHDGFLTPRPRAWTSGFQLSIHCANGMTGTILLQNDPASAWILKSELAAEPVVRRAWTLQEHFMPVRAISFGSACVQWYCRSAAFQENRYIDDEVHRADSLLRVCLDDEKIRTLYGQRDIFMPWAFLLLDFTGRGITVAADQLPALSGIVKRIGQATGHAYVAGLWLHMLPACLMWETSQDDRVVDNIRPTTYRAPTWSWASIENGGAIHAYGALYEPRDGQPPSVSPHFCLLSMSVEPAISEAPFGNLRSASLGIRGRMRRIGMYELHAPSSAEHFPYMMVQFDLGSAWADQHAESKDDVWLLELGADIVPCGLILVPATSVF